MDNLNSFKCKNCEAQLDPREAKGRVLTCGYCQSIFTLPKERASSKVLAFLRSGEQNLETRHFDDAFIMYQRAAEEDPNESEAYFGMALATAQVQYLKDYRANGRDFSTDFRMQPICYEVSEKKFTDDKNYLKAIELATPEQKIAYGEKGEEIDKIRAEFCELKKSGLSYDCFICVKVSSEDGKGHTEDALLATQLYHSLKDAGYHPFFSEEEMKDRSGAKYEALILYALYSSDCMLVVCTNADYLQTPWVKNEYTRYMKMLVEEEKQCESITVAFQGTPIEKLPGLSGKIQGIDLKKYDGLSRILNFVDRFASSKNMIPEIERKDYSGTSYKKKQVNRQGVIKRELTTIGGGELTVSDRSKLNIAAEFMTRKDFPNALRFLDNMLRENAGNGEAYFLRFLAENKCASEQEFEKNDFRVHGFESLENAIAATQDSARRRKFYDLLYRHILSTEDLAAYREFTELPDSSDRQIAELSNMMYQQALKSVDEKIFDEVIRTITNTDKYIAMNLEFAHTLRNSNRNPLKYYKNILGADEGHGEALWEVFASAHGENGEALFAYCSEEGLSVLESALFAYGYNAYAAKKILGLCIQHAIKKIEQACRLFDFLLAMTPKDQETAFQDSICQMVGKLLRGKKFDTAKKYNESLLSSNPLAHEGYFNRVLLKNRFANPLGIIDLEGKLLEDADYFSAINSYAERFPNKPNLYLDINEAVKELNEKLSDPECRDYLKTNVIVPAEQIPKCLESLLDALNKEAERYFNVVLERYHCQSSDDLLKLSQDITKDSDFLQAVKFAECADKKNGRIIQTYKKQKEASRDVRSENRKERTTRGFFITAIVCEGLLIILSIIAMIGANHPSEFIVFPFFAELFDHQVDVLFWISIIFFIMVPVALLGFSIYHYFGGNPIVCNVLDPIVIALFLVVVIVGGINTFTGDTVVYYESGYSLFIEKGRESVSIDVSWGWRSEDRAAYCGVVKELEIPSEIYGLPVTGIGEGAFQDDTSLITIIIPDTVTSIGFATFSGCSELKTIIYNGTIEDWGKIEKGSYWNADLYSGHPTGDFTITCTDGVLNKSGTVISS